MPLHRQMRAFMPTDIRPMEPIIKNQSLMPLQQPLQDMVVNHIKEEDVLLMVDQDQDQDPSPDQVDHGPQREREDQEKDMVDPLHLRARQEELTSLRQEEPIG